MSAKRIRWPRLARSWSGAIGLAILAIVLIVALFGPLVAPHGISDVVGAPGQPPSPGSLLGTDDLGRDVLSRVLYGGRSVVWTASAATAIAYAVGVTVGVVAGYSRSLLDPFLMRGVDVLLSVPSLLLILLLVSALGAGIWVVIVGVALVLIPPIARVVRAVTLETATRSYVEAAELRGESTASVLWREILPNALPVLLADFGIRFGAAVILIASINYLGFGLQPPAADWGVMIAENQAFVTLNVWSVLAPAIMLALLTVGVNLAADAYVRTLARSDVAARPASHELASETRASGDAASSGSALTATAAPGTE